jgi:hypothetical protein
MSSRALSPPPPPPPPPPPHNPAPPPPPPPPHPKNSPEPPTFDIVDAHRLLANLTLNSTRLARQFQKTLDQLRNIQLERLERQHCELKDAAAILELNKYEGVPWEPSDHGFVFSKDQVERFAQRMIRQNQSHHIAYARFQMPYRPIPSSELQPSAEAMTHLEKTTAHHSQPQAPSPPRSATASH